MEKCDIEKELNELINDCMEIKIEQLTEDEKNYPLLSSRLGGMPYQMLVLFMKVEKIFGITIDGEKIVNGEFNSYTDIVKIIEEKLRDNLCV